MGWIISGAAIGRFLKNDGIIKYKDQWLYNINVMDNIYIILYIYIYMYGINEIHGINGIYI